MKKTKPGIYIRENDLELVVIESDPFGWSTFFRVGINLPWGTRSFDVFIKKGKWHFCCEE